MISCDFPIILYDSFLAFKILPWIFCDFKWFHVIPMIPYDFFGFDCSSYGFLMISTTFQWFLWIPFRFCMIFIWFHYDLLWFLRISITLLWLLHFPKAFFDFYWLLWISNEFIGFRKLSQASLWSLLIIIIIIVHYIIQQLAFTKKSFRLQIQLNWTSIKF